MSNNPQARNNVSPHGGKFHAQIVSNGTLRTQDLLRAFADEFARLQPFNSLSQVTEARELAQRLDNNDTTAQEPAGELLLSLMDELDHIAAAHDHYFGASEGDGACFGFWPVEDEELVE